MCLCVYAHSAASPRTCLNYETLAVFLPPRLQLEQATRCTLGVLYKSALSPTTKYLSIYALIAQVPLYASGTKTWQGCTTTEGLCNCELTRDYGVKGELVWYNSDQSFVSATEAVMRLSPVVYILRPSTLKQIV